MKLPKLADFAFRDKTVLLRLDLDIPLKDGKIEDDTRIKESLPTIKCLLDQQAKVILLGHLGRPQGKVVDEFKLSPVAEKLGELFNFQLSILNFQIGNFDAYKISDNVILLENLRFDFREENNNEIFARELAQLGDFYVDEAFATSHRAHASIVGIPKFLPHAAGLHFASEVENLSKIIENPKKPLVFVIGGVKPETKLPMVVDFAKTADWVLVGGTLVQSSSRQRRDKVQSYNLKCKIVYGNLTHGGFDIDEISIRKFSEIIKNAGTVVWNGPMGKYEGEKWETGTRKIAEAMASCLGFKVVGGGDTIAALTKFGLIDKMDYVSTGGGAMLEFLAKRTLPGIEALTN